MEESEHNEGFRVVDRRRFTSDGESKAKEPEERQSPPAAEQAEHFEAQRADTQQASGAEEGERSGRKQPPPPMDFSLFILSLANTALFQLGLIRAPDSQDVKQDIPGARQTIDILAILEEKTRGNLSDQEKSLLADTLFQLRMAFVEATR
jgi:hypothetical protein